jgi:hypothetical protein
VGGAGEALEKLREVLELPLLHPERFVALGIDPPKVRVAAHAAAVAAREVPGCSSASQRSSSSRF